MATNDNIPTPEGIAQWNADPDGSKRRAAGNPPVDDLARRRLEAQTAKDAWKPPHDALWQAAHPDEGGALYLKLSPRDDAGAAIFGFVPRGTDRLADQYRDIGEAVAAQFGELQSELAAIDADPDTSDTGKAKRRGEAHAKAMKALALTAQEFDRHDRVVREQCSEVLPFVQDYQPGDAATAMIDLALAQQYKGLTGTDRTNAMAALLSGGAPRLADALLRLPGVLTGIPSTTLGTLRDQARARMHPAETQRRAGLESSSAAARQALEQAHRRIAASGHLDRRQQAALLNDAARLFGIE